MLGIGAGFENEKKDSNQSSSSLFIWKSPLANTNIFGCHRKFKTDRVPPNAKFRHLSLMSRLTYSRQKAAFKMPFFSRLSYLKILELKMNAFESQRELFELCYKTLPA